MTGCVPYPPLSGVAGTPALACGHSFRVLLSRECCRGGRADLGGLHCWACGCAQSAAFASVPCHTAAAHAAQGCPVVWLFVCAVVATLRCTGHSLCCRAGAPPSGSVGVGRAVPQALTHQYSIDQPMPLTALVSVPSGSRSGCGLPPGLARFRASPRFTVPSRRAACLPVCLFACLCCRDCGWFVPLRRSFVCLFACVRACVLAFCALLPFALYGRYVFPFLRGRPFHLAQGSAADSLARVWCGGGAEAACCRRRSVRALDDARGGVPVRP